MQLILCTFKRQKIGFNYKFTINQKFTIDLTSFVNYSFFETIFCETFQIFFWSVNLNPSLF